MDLLELYTTIKESKYRIDQRDSLIGDLLKSESNKIDKINQSMIKIDSLQDLNKSYYITQPYLVKFSVFVSILFMFLYHLQLGPGKTHQGSQRGGDKV